MNPLLAIKNLTVSVSEKTIIQDLNLQIMPGQTHVIMGKNGSGKSTLANVIAGNPDYQATGLLEFASQNLLELSIDERAKLGLFMSFQHPVAIPGVSTIQFLKTAVNAIRQAQNLSPYDAVDFLAMVKEKMQDVGLDSDFLSRSLHDGFSGGEQKRLEILQLSLLQPKLAILDEIDSGLDIDALKDIAKVINANRNNDNACLLITHYQRILDYIVPDVVHVMQEGKIIYSGTKELPQQLEKQGYAWLTQGEHV